MKYSENNKPIVCMQTNSACYKGTSTMTVKGVLWHSTGANNPTIKRYVQPSDDATDRDEMLELLGVNKNKNDWNHTSRKAGLNCWIGKLANGSVATVQTMPWNYKPWGCGGGSKGSCNNGWIQFEICEDALTDKTYFNAVYKEACEITAYLCDMYNLNPYGTVVVNGVNVPVILCHADSYKLGMGSNHGDVLHWFKKHGKTMDDVRNDVAKLMGIVNNTTSKGLQAVDFQSMEKAKVIEKVGALFTADQKKSGILASISLAQFIIETGYGKSELAKNANNMFGMKCNLSGNTWSGSTWDGTKYTKQTKEYVNGEYVTVTANFRKYSCVEDSIADHSAYLLGAKRGTALRYNGLKGETDYKAAAQIIKNGGYATSPTYADHICDVIERWNLTKYDASMANVSIFKVGDKVKLISGAKYTSGASIPAWVFKKTLYVRAINGNNITISTLKSGAITGTVKERYLVSCTSNNATSSESNKKEEIVESTTSTSFKVGDEVRLVSGAKFTSGKSIASWAFKKKMYVRAINGDNITISTLKSGAITGTVKGKYLVSYSGNDTTVSKPTTEDSVSKPTTENNNTTNFKVGDKVKLVSGAKFTSGQSIASWVFKKTLYIRQLKSDCAVVSTLKSGAVTGTVALKYLTKI